MGVLVPHGRRGRGDGAPSALVTKGKQARALTARHAMGYTGILSVVLLIGGLVAADALANDGAGLLFLARKLATLIEYLAIWR